MKAIAIKALGEDALERPARVNAALAANDRLKCYFSLLQMARVHAEAPDQPAVSLKRERRACGLTDDTLDEAIANASKTRDGYRVPGCQKIVRAIADDLKTMAAPADPSLGARGDSLLKSLPAVHDDVITGDCIDAITRSGGKGHDSLHALVMDLHKVLNAQQASLAEEVIDGASTYNIDTADHALIHAFMSGLNRTAPLKFDHPGLGCTATRMNGKLVIQNDLGTTDAHVLVVHVSGLMVSVTYSDIHAERLQFFQSLLERRAVHWSGAESRVVSGLAGGEPLLLTVGTHTAADRDGVADFLAFLGSRLVFVIDWNKARKQLRGLIKRQHRVDLLRWAADNDIGQRGFLELGGARLVYDAVEANASGLMHLGDRLCDLLGDEPAYQFLQFCFRSATEGLLAHQSPGLIRDRIRTELVAHIAGEERRLLSIAARHAGLIFEIAGAVRDGLIAVAEGEGGFDRLTKRARQWEHAADLLVIEAREMVKRRPDHASYARIITAADDAADDLEGIVFLLGLFGKDPDIRKLLEPLRLLADIQVASTQEWIKALAHASQVGPHGAREDADDFVTAVDRIAVLEHEADDALRDVVSEAVPRAKDFRQLHLITAIGGALETATDALEHASLMLRDHILSDVLVR